MREGRLFPEGVTIIEALVALALFLGFSVATYGIVASLARANARESERIATLAVANEQVEIIRNLPYASVGTVGGIPSGVVAQSRTLTRNNRTFTITTTIRNIDDPFDGTLGGTPNDTAPADYKLAIVDVNCQGCTTASDAELTTIVAPNGLEIAGNSGALFIRVINALGQPVSDASVHVVNSNVSPAVDLTDITDTNGNLQLVGVPPSVNNYQITATKTGYSTDQTYTATAQNPNPSKPPATVAVGQVTQVTLAIDTLATLNINTTTSACAPIPNVSFRLDGTKLIGTNPNVLKYTETTTSGSGASLSRSLEWDTYALTLTDPSYSLIGTVGTLPVNLVPSATQNISLVLGTPTTNGLHITVEDNVTKLPLSGAQVHATGPSGYDQTFVTGRGYLLQTDWSGGSGQDTFQDITKYSSDDGHIDHATLPGQVTLTQTSGVYDTDGTLTSSTFDTGGSTNFLTLSWAPVSQPLSVGQGVKFQIATNNDNTTWNFLGPDGTSNTYFTAVNTSINAANNGTRYLRYKLFLHTDDTTATPIVSDVAISFTSSCIPPGQVFFSGIQSGSYTIDTSDTGYVSDEQMTNVSGWTNLDVQLQPNS